MVAISGGPDSVCLGHSAAVWAGSSDSRLVLAHFDHRLRPDSADDARFVADLARSWEVACEIGRAPDPPATLPARSPELWARRRRWEFLESCARAQNAAAILTAHHLGDQAETLLLRLLRGSGSAGLSAMPVVTRRFDPPRVRPLLGLPRRALTDYLEAERLPFRSDPSNLEPTTDRNRIRLQVLPLLEQIRPGAQATIARAADNLGFEAELLAELADAARPRAGVRAIAGAYEFDAAGFAALGPTLQHLLLRSLCEEIAGQVPRRTVLHNASAFCGGPGPATLQLTPAVEIERSRGYCLLRRSNWRPAAPPAPRLLGLGNPDPVRFLGHRFRLDPGSAPETGAGSTQLRLPSGTTQLELAAIPATASALDRLPPWRRQSTPGVFIGKDLIWGLGLGVVAGPLPAGTAPIVATLRCRPLAGAPAQPE